MNTPFAPANPLRLKQLAVITASGFGGSLALCIVLGMLLGVLGVSGLASPEAMERASRGAGAALSGLLLIAMLVSVVFYGIFIYRAWRVVEYDGVLLSPVAAVLLSVIPVVNLVGCFLTFYGLAKEMNRVAMRHGATRRPANEGARPCSVPLLCVRRGLRLHPAHRLPFLAGGAREHDHVDDLHGPARQHRRSPRRRAARHAPCVAR